MSNVPVSVVNVRCGLTSVLGKTPEEHWNSSRQKPQIIVPADKATIGTKSTANTRKDQEFTQVPRLDQAWLFFTQSHLVSSDRVSTKHSIDLGYFLLCDLSKLLSKL